MVCLELQRERMSHFITFGLRGQKFPQGKKKWDLLGAEQHYGLRHANVRIMLSDVFGVCVCHWISRACMGLCL